MRPHFPPREALSDEWTMARAGRIVHADSAEHAALVARTLSLDLPTWRAMLDAYAPEGFAVDEALSALASAVRQCVPSPAPAGRGSVCLICGGSMRPAFVRPLLSDGPRQGQLVYAQCEACDHVALVEGGERASIYAGADYFTARRATGAGYDGYESERAYREAKGRRIIQWIARSRPRAGRFLEVGSGYGYTCRAAAEAGWLTCGVDLSRHAADRSRALYGMQTHVGTLQECLDERRLEAASWDVVLYQFVLEHVADPIRELQLAASALAPLGILALVVPSAGAAEVDIFGGRYRSFRGDHLHVFSHRSLEMALRAAGLEVASQSTSCGIHLLRGFLSDDALTDLYARGRGPDIYLLAKRIQP